MPLGDNGLPRLPPEVTDKEILDHIRNDPGPDILESEIEAITLATGLKYIKGLGQLLKYVGKELVESLVSQFGVPTKTRKLADTRVSIGVVEGLGGQAGDTARKLKGVSLKGIDTPASKSADSRAT